MAKSRTSSCRGRNSFSLLFFFLILVLAFTAGSAQALTFTVDSTYDDVDTDGLNGVCYSSAADGCTLRAAIQEANLSGDDVIMLSAGTYALSIPGTGENAAVTGDLDIVTAGTLTIIGSDAGSTIDGAGIDRVFDVLAGTVSISKVTITNGASPDVGGGISNIGILSLSDITISSNTAIDPTFGVGGGIYNYSGGEITLTNVTISGNTAGTDGGGIYNDDTMEITNVTIANNVATAGAGGGIYTAGTTTIKNTILDNNTSALDGNCAGGGTLASNGYNVSSDDTCNFLETGDWNNTDPLLGALADNGGPTFTHSLTAGSPAIDTGDMTDAPVTDQRGVPRPQDGDANGSAVCDIGAYEAGILLLTPTAGEKICGGESYSITWAAPPGAVYFNLQYSLDNGLKWRKLAKKIAGSSYSWLTPFPKRSFPNSLIKIYAYNMRKQMIGYDILESNFEIMFADITSPVGGEIYYPGDSVRIEWDVCTTDVPVFDTTLFYSTDCGSKWELITTLPGGMRSYNWTVPAVIQDMPCTMFKLQLRDSRGKSLTYETSPSFQILLAP